MAPVIRKRATIPRGWGAWRCPRRWWIGSRNRMHSKRRMTQVPNIVDNRGRRNAMFCFPSQPIWAHAEHIRDRTQFVNRRVAVSECERRRFRGGEPQRCSCGDPSSQGGKRQACIGAGLPKTTSFDPYSGHQFGDSAQRPRRVQPIAPVLKCLTHLSCCRHLARLVLTSPLKRVWRAPLSNARHRTPTAESPASFVAAGLSILDSRPRSTVRRQPGPVKEGCGCRHIVGRPRTLISAGRLPDSKWILFSLRRSATSNQGVLVGRPAEVVLPGGLGVI